MIPPPDCELRRHATGGRAHASSRLAEFVYTLPADFADVPKHSSRRGSSAQITYGSVGDGVGVGDDVGVDVGVGVGDSVGVGDEGGGDEGGGGGGGDSVGDADGDSVGGVAVGDDDGDGDCDGVAGGDGVGDVATTRITAGDSEAVVDVTAESLRSSVAAGGLNRLTPGPRCGSTAEGSTGLPESPPPDSTNAATAPAPARIAAPAPAWRRGRRSTARAAATSAAPWDLGRARKSRFRSTSAAIDAASSAIEASSAAMPSKRRSSASR